MAAPLVVTILGPDRPGLVEDMATRIARHGGNWVESRMCRLGGHFAGILRAEVPEAAIEAASEDLGNLRAEGYAVGIEAESSLPKTDRPGKLASLDLLGQDRPGIVREITRILAARSVNVEEMSSGCESAPMSGERLFRAHFLVMIPPSCHEPELRHELEALGNDLVAEIHFELEPGKAPLSR